MFSVSKLFQKASIDSKLHFKVTYLSIFFPMYVFLVLGRVFRQKKNLGLLNRRLIFDKTTIDKFLLPF